MSFFFQIQQSPITHRTSLRLAWLVWLLNLNHYAIIRRLVALRSWRPARSGSMIERTQKRTQKRRRPPMQTRAEKGGAA